MKVRLNWIEIKYFKGVSYFKAEFSGESAVILGKNGSGKTTVADAFYWLFTDQDSNYQGKFNLLELSHLGRTIDKQDAEVESELWVGSRVIRLKKIHKQKWTKKRGSAHAELTGHTTEHFFDGIPLSKTKYNAKLSELMNIGIIRLLCDIYHFCGNLKPEERRNVLMDISGDVPEQEIIKQFKGLDTILNGHLVEDAKKKLRYQKGKVEDELNQMPGKIEELQNMMPDIEGMDEDQIIEQIKLIKDDIAKNQNKILEIRSGKELNDLKADRSKLESEIDDIKYQKEKFQLNRTMGHYLVDIERLEKNIAADQDNIKNNKEIQAELFLKWRKIDAKKFKSSTKCFACNQQLPADQISKQRSEFNAKQARDLKYIDDKGKAANNMVEVWSDEIKQFNKDIADLREKIGVKSKELEAIHDRCKAEKDLIKEHQAEIDAKIKQLEQDIEPEISSLETVLMGLETKKADLEAKKLDFTQVEKVTRSIKERKKGQKRLAKEFEEIESKLMMIDDFSRKKSEYIERNVSSNFEITHWKLFIDLIGSDGIREICEATFQGVPYSTDLNTGAKINLGLDCIRTLSSHYNLSMPIWIDNAESITDWLIDTKDMQTIKLAANPEYKELEVING